jgi:hypothetical protein
MTDTSHVVLLTLGSLFATITVIMGIVAISTQTLQKTTFFWLTLMFAIITTSFFVIWWIRGSECEPTNEGAIPCGGNCSGNGTCVDGVCMCVGDYGGTMCDIPLSESPSDDLINTTYGTHALANINSNEPLFLRLRPGSYGRISMAYDVCGQKVGLFPGKAIWRFNQDGEQNFEAFQIHHTLPDARLAVNEDGVVFLSTSGPWLKLFPDFTTGTVHVGQAHSSSQLTFNSTSAQISVSSPSSSSNYHWRINISSRFVSEPVGYIQNSLFDNASGNHEMVIKDNDTGMYLGVTHVNIQGMSAARLGFTYTPTTATYNKTGAQMLDFKSEFMGSTKYTVDQSMASTIFCYFQNNLEVENNIGTIWNLQNQKYLNKSGKSVVWGKTPITKWIFGYPEDQNETVVASNYLKSNNADTPVDPGMYAIRTITGKGFLGFNKCDTNLRIQPGGVNWMWNLSGSHTLRPRGSNLNHCVLGNKLAPCSIDTINIRGYTTTRGWISATITVDSGTSYLGHDGNMVIKIPVSENTQPPRWKLQPRRMDIEIPDTTDLVPYGGRYYLKTMLSDGTPGYAMAIPTVVGKFYHLGINRNLCGATPWTYNGNGLQQLSTDDGLSLSNGVYLDNEDIAPPIWWFNNGTIFNPRTDRYLSVNNRETLVVWEKEPPNITWTAVPIGDDDVPLSQKTSTSRTYMTPHDIFITAKEKRGFFPFR